MKRKEAGREGRELSQITRRPRRRYRSLLANRRQRSSANEALSLFTWRY